MSIQLPVELADVAAVTGVAWPQADEDAMAAEAGAWRQAGDAVSRLAADADGAAQAALGVVEGEAANTARRHWDTFVAPDSGRLPSVVTACHQAADRLLHGAEQVAAAKVGIIEELVALAQKRDAAEVAAGAGHPTAMLGIDTLVAGSANSLVQLTGGLTETVRLDAGTGTVDAVLPAAVDAPTAPSGAAGEGPLGPVLGAVLPDPGGAVLPDVPVEAVSPVMSEDVPDTTAGPEIVTDPDAEITGPVAVDETTGPVTTGLAAGLATAPAATAAAADAPVAPRPEAAAAAVSGGGTTSAAAPVGGQAPAGGAAPARPGLATPGPSGPPGSPAPQPVTRLVPVVVSDHGENRRPGDAEPRPVVQPRRGFDEVAAVALAFGAGPVRRVRPRPARQVPPPLRETDTAAGLRFPPGDHPQSGLIRGDEALLAVRAGRAAARLLDGVDAAGPVTDHDPLGGMHEREWDRRFLVRSATARSTAEYAWPPGEVFPEGGSDRAGGEPIVLDPGTELDRFGRAEGRVFGRPGAPFAARSLPPEHRDAGYHRYRVLRPLPVWWAVAASWFGQPGGGERFRATHAVVDLVALGYLEELEEVPS